MIILLTLDLIAKVFEGISIAILLPLFEYFSSSQVTPGTPETHKVIVYINKILESTGFQLTLENLLILITIALLLRGLFVCIHKIYKSWFRHGLLKYMRMNMFQVVLETPAGKYSKKELGRFINDVLIEAERSVRTIILSIVLIGVLLMVLFYVSFLMTLSANLTLLVFTVVILEVFCLKKLFDMTKKRSAELSLVNRDLASYLHERLSNQRLIRLSASKNKECELNDNATKNQFLRNMAIVKVGASINFIIEFFVVITLIGAFVFGHFELGLALSVLMVFVGIVLRVWKLTKKILGKYQKLLSQSGGFYMVRNRYAELLRDKEQHPGKDLFNKLENKITIKNVSCFIDRKIKQKALNNIDIEIPANKITAIVGPSGAGKTTLIELLPGLRKHDSGEIYFDDVPISSYSLSSLRDGIAYVPQAPQFLNHTINEHFRYGNPGLTDEEIEEAIDITNTGELIEQIGLDKKLGEDAIILSGGQKQRIELTRAVAKKTPILILDEPSSNLDYESEKILCDSLLDIRSKLNKTIIVIAHRYSTIIHADKIIVLQEGQVDDMGTHNELLKSAGWYAKAFMKQFSQRAI